MIRDPLLAACRWAADSGSIFVVGSLGNAQEREAGALPTVQSARRAHWTAWGVAMGRTGSHPFCLDAKLLFRLAAWESFPAIRCRWMFWRRKNSVVKPAESARAQWKRAFGGMR